MISVAASTLLAVSDGLLVEGGGVIWFEFDAEEEDGLWNEGGGWLKFGGGRLKSGT